MLKIQLKAAHCYDIDEKRRQISGYEAQLHRQNLKLEIAAAVFSVKPGVVISSIKTDPGDMILSELVLPISTKKPGFLT